MKFAHFNFFKFQDVKVKVFNNCAYLENRFTTRNYFFHAYFQELFKA